MVYQALYHLASQNEIRNSVFRFWLVVLFLIGIFIIGSLPIKKIEDKWRTIQRNLTKRIPIGCHKVIAMSMSLCRRNVIPISVEGVVT